MQISKERLLSEAESTGFRPEVLEKVILLLNLLENLGKHPFLKGKLALKGGTALNLFMFNLPRLSVDIDLNYIGSTDLETMEKERPKIEKAVQDVCARDDLEIRRLPREHAGGKWRLRYQSAIGQSGNLELDLNFMFRIPLWSVEVHDSHMIGSYKASNVLLLNIHELAAGKMAALFARQASRDLFDVYLLLTQQELNAEHLRLAFVVYGAMNRKDWRIVSLDDIAFDQRNLRDTLVPVLQKEYLASQDIEEWGAGLVESCKKALAIVLPFSESENEFLDLILDRGEIKPALLTKDAGLADRIANHPLLQWKALNVRKHKSN
jgi:predicted nucleotidyltransferase component of viral defense system